MRRCWGTSAAIVLIGLFPLVGCHQLPKNKSAQELRPVDQKSSASPVPELTAADIFQNAMAQADQLQGENRLADAIAACEKLREPGGPWAWHASWKIALLCENDPAHFDRAEDEYERLKQAQPGNADIHSKLGDLNVRRRRLGFAEKHYNTALMLQPNHVPARSGLAFMLASDGRYEQSLNEYAVLYPNTNQGRAEAYCSVAAILETQGKRKEAASCYEEALRLEPNSKTARGQLLKLRETDRSSIGAITSDRIIETKGKAGSIELEEALPQIADGNSRTMVQHATLPPLPPLPPIEMPRENPREWKSSKTR